MQLKNRIEYLKYVEKQPEKTAVFYGDYNNFDKTKLWEIYDQIKDYDKVIVPIASPNDNTFFNHFFELVTIFGEYRTDIELYLSSNFTESIENKSYLLIRHATSIKIVHNPVIVHIPFEKRRKPFYDFIKSLLGDTAEVFEIDEKDKK